MSKYIISIVFFILAFQLGVFSQCDTINYNPQKGEIIKTEYFNNKAVILTDTCIFLNRITQFMLYQKDMDYEDETFLPAFIVTTEQINRIEKYLLNHSKLTTKDKNYLRKFVRLYIGCIDYSNNKCIVVQFLKKKQFCKDKFFKYSINPVVIGNMNARIAYFKINDDKVELLNWFFKEIPTLGVD